MKNIGNLLFENMKGSLRLSKNFRLVVKRYKTGTVLSTYPRKKKIKSSGNQPHAQNSFKRAVAHAQMILANPEAKAALEARLKEGEKVYHAAIREFMEKEKALKASAPQTNIRAKTKRKKK